jgi:hypothetical protein
MVSLKEARTQNRIPKKRNTSRKRNEKKTQSLLGQFFFTNLEHQTCSTEPKVYKILKYISKDKKETVKIHENIDENIFLIYEKLCNTTNIN